MNMSHMLRFWKSEILKVCSCFSIIPVEQYICGIYKKNGSLISGQDFSYFPPDVPSPSGTGYHNFHNQWQASSK